MKANIVLLFVLCITIFSFGQSTLYLEDFEGQTIKGAVGPGGNNPTINLNGVTWSIDVSDTDLSETLDWFNVQNSNGNAYLEGTDLDGDAIWLSPILDISNHTNIAFSLDATQGPNKLKNSDTVTTEYRIDGGNWTVATTNGSLNKNYGDVVVSQTGLNGSTLEIRVTMYNNKNNKKQRIDNIEVTGFNSCLTGLNPIYFGGNYASTTSISLDWVLNSCNDDYLIIAKEANATSAIPSGDGSAYNANSSFGTGTEIATNEFVVYKGNLSTSIISNLVFGNTYYLTIFGRNGTSWSSGVSLYYSLQDYCPSIGMVDSNDTAIKKVVFGDINNGTNQGSGYEFFTEESTEIARGASENLEVKIKTGNDNSVYTFAWIDWNQDGDFDEANEAYDLGETFDENNGETANSPLSIVAPIDAALGDTRLRILCQLYTGAIPTNGPCDGSTNGEIEDYTVTVLPGNTYIYDDDWITDDPNGEATIGDDIIIISGEAIFDEDTSCKTITVNAGANVNIETDVNLTTVLGMTLESSSISYASLILDGAIVGTIKYERFVNANSNGNDLISPPLSGQAWADFLSSDSNADDLVMGNILGTPTYLFGPFDKTIDNFVNYTDATSASLISGTGYRAGTDVGTTLTFTGTVPTTSIAVNIEDTGATYPDWNLIGNPYPSYIDMTLFLNYVLDNVIGPDIKNIDILEDLSGIYGYDGSASNGWDIITLANSAGRLMAPGQGFFVAADAIDVAAYDITFDPSMRTVGSIGAYDDFIAGRNASLLSFLKLNATTVNKNYKTEFYFNTNASLGLDHGYDGKILGSAPNFALYSHLVLDNTGLPIALQALNPSDLTNTTIPLGVNASQGEQLTFSISESTLPDTVEVYLEDKITNTFTLLNTGDYTLTPNENLSGVGRFFLNFTNSVLAIPENSLNDVSIYANQDDKTIVISGQLSESTTAYIYDIQGRVVSTSRLETTRRSQFIDVSSLITGVYVVRLFNGTLNKTQKVIIR